MSGQAPDPDEDHRPPWWETGEAPEGVALPRSASRRVLLALSVVAAVALVGFVIWELVTGAASMASMPM